MAVFVSDGFRIESGTRDLISFVCERLDDVGCRRHLAVLRRVMISVTRGWLRTSCAHEWNFSRVDAANPAARLLNECIGAHATVLHTCNVFASSCIARLLSTIPAYAPARAAYGGVLAHRLSKMSAEVYLIRIGIPYSVVIVRHLGLKCYSRTHRLCSFPCSVSRSPFCSVLNVSTFFSSGTRAFSFP